MSQNLFFDQAHGQFRYRPIVQIWQGSREVQPEWQRLSTLEYSSLLSVPGDASSMAGLAWRIGLVMAGILTDGGVAERVVITNSFEQKILYIVEKLLKPNPRERLAADEVIEHLLVAPLAAVESPFLPRNTPTLQGKYVIFQTKMHPALSLVSYEAVCHLLETLEKETDFISQHAYFMLLIALVTSARLDSLEQSFKRLNITLSVFHNVDEELKRKFLLVWQNYSIHAHEFRQEMYKIEALGEKWITALLRKIQNGLGIHCDPLNIHLLRNCRATAPAAYGAFFDLTFSQPISNASICEDEEAHVSQRSESLDLTVQRFIHRLGHVNHYPMEDATWMMS